MDSRSRNPEGPPPRRPVINSGPTLNERLDEVFEARDVPFFLAVDELHHGQNLATLLRVADAGGVHGIVLPPARSHPGPTRPVRQMAGAACDRVPLHREGLQSALTTLRRAGVLVVGAAEDGDKLFDELDYRYATAFVLGGEDKGLSPAVRKKCDVLVRLPMHGHVPSLNVAATASVLVFERMRQIRGAEEADRAAEDARRATEDAMRAAADAERVAAPLADSESPAPPEDAERAAPTAGDEE